MSSSPSQEQLPYESADKLVSAPGYYPLYTVLISTIAWCCVITLAINALQAKSKEHDTYSPKRRWFLLCYVVLMTGISSAALVQSILSFRCESMASPCRGISISRLETAKSFPMLLAIFGADGLMVWRCWVLYQGVRHILKVLVDCLLTGFILLTMGFVFGALVMLSQEVVIINTIGINFALSIMITCRLLVHERAMKAVFGAERGVSPFKKVMAMCVESCALIVLCGSVLLGTYLTNLEKIPASAVAEAISTTLMPHICVISPLLLIVRVANGRAHSTTIPSFPTEVAEVRNASTGYHHSTSAMATGMSGSGLSANTRG